ncbi:hypothetical protein [Paenibacillus sp. TC-CSREp1]|uniref:hypothetical protein n=1 Tax=Paenibacillus sp. TC-CSREp1 TaxID=3410089 RepID=UPI003D0002B8
MNQPIYSVWPIHAKPMTAYDLYPITAQSNRYVAHATKLYPTPYISHESRLAVNVPQSLVIYSKGSKRATPKAIDLLHHFEAYQHTPKITANMGHNTNTTNNGFIPSNHQ